MSFRYKFKGVWDDQLPLELREPYAASRTTKTPYGAQRPGPYLWIVMSAVFLAVGMYVLITSFIGSHPDHNLSDWLITTFIVVVAALMARWGLRYAWIRLSWAHKVKQLTGVNPLTWDLTKPLPTRGRPDIPLRRQG